MINYLAQRQAMNTEHSGSLILSQGQDKLFVEIEKLDAPFRRFDGKRVSYQLHVAYLSVDCEHEEDEAWACVSGNAHEYWSKKELQSIGIEPSKKRPFSEDYNLFDHVIIQ